VQEISSLEIGIDVNRGVGMCVCGDCATSGTEGEMARGDRGCASASGAALLLARGGKPCI
jgi:hypothetical protein